MGASGHRPRHVHASLGTSAKAAVDRGATLLNRRKALRLVPEAGADLISQSIEAGLPASSTKLSRTSLARNVSRRPRAPRLCSAAGGSGRHHRGEAGGRKGFGKIANRGRWEGSSRAGRPPRRRERASGAKACREG